jgi:serine phosphatase RsbU (regulator of sigma subunit)
MVRRDVAIWSPSQEGSVVKDAKVLLIDDDDMVRSALMAMLSLIGHQPVGVADGEQGLGLLRREKFDVVLSDMRMPVLDGVGFLKAVATITDAPPVIVMSGAGLLDDAISALKLGAWDYLAKPVAGIDVLEHTIHRVLERKTLVDENRRINAELRRALGVLAEEESVGRQLQARMLPQNHVHFDGFEFSRALIPSLYLSGDFVDAFRVDEKRWAFYLADVAGHGVSAALVTVLLRGVVQRHLGTPLLRSPSQLLQRLNEELAQEPVDRHVTLFYGVFDTDRGTLAWANAGHFPSPWLTDGTRIVDFDGSGVPLGLTPNSTYEEHTFVLPEQFALFACSDGLFEVVSGASPQEKRTKLQKALGTMALSIEEAQAALHLTEQSLPDDVTMVLVKGKNLHAGNGPLRTA